MSKMPRFLSARLLVENPRRPKITADLKFKDAASAARFTCAGLKSGIKGLITGGGWLLGPYINRVSCVQNEEYVTVTGVYTQREILGVMRTITPFIRGPRSLDKLPVPPQVAAKAAQHQGASAPAPDASAAQGAAGGEASPAAAAAPSDKVAQDKPTVVKKPFTLFGSALPSEADIKRAKAKAAQGKEGEDGQQDEQKAPTKP